MTPKTKTATATITCKCGDPATQPCGRTQQILDDLLTKNLPGSVFKEYFVKLPCVDGRILTHCVDCMMKISKHVAAANTLQRRMSSPGTRSMRTKLANMYGGCCQISGESIKYCHQIHIFPGRNGGPAFKTQFPHLTESDIDSEKNVIFLWSAFNDPIDNADLAFRPTRQKGHYTVFVPRPISCPLLAEFNGMPVQLAADPKVLAWLLCRAEANVEPAGADGSGGRGRGGADGSGGRGRGGADGSGGRGRGAGPKGGKRPREDDEGSHVSQDLRCFDDLPRDYPVHPNHNLTAFNLALSQVV